MSSYQVFGSCAVLLLLLLMAMATYCNAQTQIPISEADKEAIVAAHNMIRSEAEATDMLTMVYDDSLAVFPQQYALACAFEHSDRGDRAVQPYPSVGENLYITTAGTLDYHSAIYTSWGTSERQHYSYNSNTCAAGQVCGHYTQLVWGSTGNVGCGAARCPTVTGTTFNNAILLVCNYGPTGNIRGQSPYDKSGAVCSNCPNSLPQCIDNLCSPQANEPDPQEPDPQEPDPQDPDPQDPDPQEPDPQEPDPQEPEPQEPDPQEPDPQDPDPQEPDPQDPDPQEPDPQEPEPQEPDPQDPDPQEPDPQEPDPQDPDPQDPDPQDPDPQEPDPQDPDPQEPDPQDPDPQDPDPQDPDPQEPDPERGELTVRFVGGTPRIRRRTVMVMVRTNKPVESISCFLNNERQDCTSGQTVFRNVKYTNGPYEFYQLRVEATAGQEEAETFRRITVCPPSVCTVRFIDNGVTALQTRGSVRLNFGSMGPTTNFRCRVDRDDPITPCNDGDVLRKLSKGMHKIRVVPLLEKCTRRRSSNMQFMV